MDKELKNWYGQRIETQSDPLMDKGLGDAVILREFKFKSNPEAFKINQPSKQDLFNAHAQQIRITLWQDGLEPLPLEPRLAMSEDSYKIFVACKPKTGVALMETPQTLQDITKQNGNSRENTEQLHGSAELSTTA